MIQINETKVKSVLDASRAIGYDLDKLLTIKLLRPTGVVEVSLNTQAKTKEFSD